MHPFYDALPEPDAPVRIIHSAVMAHCYTYAPPRFRTYECRMTFISLSVSQWNNLCDPVFDGVGLAGLKSRANYFLLAWLLAPFLSPTLFPFSSFILLVGIVGLGSSC